MEIERGDLILGTAEVLVTSELKTHTMIGPLGVHPIRDQEKERGSGGGMVVMVGGERVVMLGGGKVEGGEGTVEEVEVTDKQEMIDKEEVIEVLTGIGTGANCSIYIHTYSMCTLILVVYI